MNHTIVWCAALFIGTCTGAQSAVPDSARIRRDFGQIPLYFEENRGQTEARVRYIARTPHHVALIAADGLTLASQDETVSMRFAGSSPKARVMAENPVEGISNYYIGARAITGVPHFSRLRVNNVLNGIDVLYYGTAQDLEYDW